MDPIKIRKVASQVNLSAKTEYACLALLELAIQHEAGRPVRVRDLAERHGIPSRFLVQILLQLKGAGLVSSTRGASGGYRLKESPESITLGAIVAVIEGTAETVSNVEKPSTLSRALLNVWQDATRAQQEVLEAVTLAELVQNVQGESSNMYYI